MSSSHQMKDQTETISLLHRKEEEERAEQSAKEHQLPYLNLVTIPIELDALKTISQNHAEEAKIAVFKRVGIHLKVALVEPGYPATKSILEKLRRDGYICEFFMVSQSSMNAAHRFYEKIAPPSSLASGSIEISPDVLLDLKERLSDRTRLARALTQASATNATTALEVILAGALRMEASDVHIETIDKGAHIRFRLDGVLHDISLLPLRLYRLILSRIKLLSELKLNIHDAAQDGRFTIHLQDQDIEVRTSVLPGPNGENIVLRLLDPKFLNVSFENLGMQPWIREALDIQIKQPYGMIVTTGPTGSGKTTALYAILQKLHSPELKIITLEDPIEYHIPGIEQTQIDATHGYDFPKGLRAIVRQDPDVILIGEIRDAETAETALAAANTGHLVFSTLHTNNAEVLSVHNAWCVCYARNARFRSRSVPH
ncbi:MAG: type IV pilus assembly protein PilB [Parcubacteria group bacterium Gr01-1014_66]|nr:MAG: type IV pilus assembly protein PilB [Parcubacteria group bacterium Gr01-1014_66]